MLQWHSDYVVSKQWETPLLKINFDIHNNKGLMGRFGGGWNWKLGIQVGGRTIVLSLLVAELSISLKKKNHLE